MFSKVLSGNLLSRSFSTFTGKLTGKIALITGASAGIGRATAIKYAQEGAKGIILADLNEEGSLETINVVKKETNFEPIFIKTDVSKPEDVKKMIQIAEKEFNGLHILFNNAGVMLSSDGDESEVDDKTWDKTFDVNVKGVMYGCKFGIPLIRKSGGGSVINTGSFVAVRGAATAQLAYTSSKGAVCAMTRELAMIHARHNVRVNSLCPGPLQTELLMKFLDTEEKKRRRLVHIPLNRFGLASEMANAAAFLGSDESSYITGSDFMVDGGLTSAYVTPED